MNKSPELTDDEDNEQPQLSPPTSDSEVMSISQKLSQEKTQTEQLLKDLDIPLIVSDISEEFNSLNFNDYRIPWNTKEKIIIVLDRCKDEELTPFEDNSDNKYNFLQVLKKAIDIFVHLKSSISEKHQYALVLLDESKATWYLDFTNNVKEVIKALDCVYEGNAEDVFDLNSLFDEIMKRVEIPDFSKDSIIPPPYIVRTILLYNRSYTYPDIKFTDSVKEILEHPFFNVDVLVSHEPVNAANNCEKIFTTLQNMDKKGYSYFFSVGRDINCLMTSVGKLLGHPLQRSIQKNVNCSLN